MQQKRGTLLPKAGTSFPGSVGRRNRDRSYPAAISAALRGELGKTHRATKTVMQWTGASERTVKNWFAGTKGPCGEHLVVLLKHSNSVLISVLRLSGRELSASEKKVIEAREKLIELFELIDQLHN